MTVKGQSTAEALAVVATRLDALVERMDRDALENHQTSQLVSQIAKTQALLVEQDKHRDERVDRIEARVTEHQDKLKILDSLRAKAIGAGMVLGAIGTAVIMVWQGFRDRILSALGL